MTRAAVICLAAAAARLSIIKYTHAWIKETANARLVSIICACIGDFHDRSLLDLVWTENPELDTHHGLDIRIWTMNSRWHLSSVLVKGF
jgi:hypothetical protein